MLLLLNRCWKALGYTSRISLLVNQLELMFGWDENEVFVCELKKKVVGFVSAHYLPQLAFEGGIVIISYLSVYDTVKDQGIAKALERYTTEQARKRKCERIQVHCMDWRTKEDQFYKQHNYQEYPKCYIKRLVYAE